MSVRNQQATVALHLLRNPSLTVDIMTSYFPRETRTLENGSNLENYWSFSIDSLTMETVDDNGISTAAASLNFETTQLLNETRYGIVRFRKLL